ncbi:transposase family protein [Micromonospora haikouensis]|nr:transposase family protein [Micromonospora sp. NBRC 110038]
MPPPGASSLSHPASIPLSNRSLNHLADLIHAHRHQQRSHWRRLSPGRQALLALAHLRNGDTFTRLAAGFGVSVATALRAQGRDIIRTTIDDFLFPRAQRYPRSEYSAEGCYLHTHDHDALNRMLLDPLGPGGDRRFQPAVYDHTTDTTLSPPIRTAPTDVVLIFDGVFLLRPELIDQWDLRISVSTALDKTVDRAVIRQRQVSSRADIIVHNDEPQQPTWETRTHDHTRFGIEAER